MLLVVELIELALARGTATAASATVDRGSSLRRASAAGLVEAQARRDTAQRAIAAAAAAAAVAVAAARAGVAAVAYAVRQSADAEGVVRPTMIVDEALLLLMVALLLLTIGGEVLTMLIAGLEGGTRARGALKQELRGRRFVVDAVVDEEAVVDVTL